MDIPGPNSVQEFLDNFKSSRHDLNNLLNNVLNAVDLLKEKTHGDVSIEYLIKQIESNTLLASNILSEVLTDNITLSDKKSLLDLKVLVETTTKFIKNDYVKIELNIPYGDYFILGNYTEIQRVFLNLISNAKEAKKDNLKIKIKLEHVCNSDVEDFVLLSITDNGVGITEENKNQLFVKGYSTKGSSTNRGLGLAIVKEIVENHSGHIQVMSEVNRGSTFRIYLPLYDKKINGKIFENKNVIIAEDDDFQREVLSDLLKSMKINVFTASNGVEALDLYYSKSPDLLFIDDKMPGMSGLECITKIRATNLESEIVLVTGSRNEDIDFNGNSVRVLNKPYSFEEVKLLLTELL